MKVYESSVLRPFGSLVRGLLTTSLVGVTLWVFGILLMYGGYGRWSPDLPLEVLKAPQFLAVAGVAWIIGLWTTLHGFGACRGTYRMAPTELEVWSGLFHKTMVALKYGQISEITLSRGPLMQLLGTYDLTIHHGSGCRGAGTTTLHGIRNGEEVRLSLLERMDSLREQKEFDD